VRGGDLANALVRRPESREGRREMMKVIREISPEILHRQGADGLVRYLNSSAAQGAGITSPLLPNETNTLLKLLREKDRGPLSKDKAEELQKLSKIWSAPPEAALPEEEIEKVESQIANLEKNMAKPYPVLSPTEREKLQKGQKENLERLKIQLTKLRATAETARRETELPKIEPAPTEKEIKGFKDIASATKSIPEKGKLENRLRMTRGAMRESFKLQQEIEKEIKEVEGLFKETQGRSERTDTLKNKSIELKAELEKLRKTESGPGGLKDKETLLERELLKKKK